MLHRVDELLGFTIHATDGDIGRVRDLYFDDHHWTVRYLVVDTGHWLPGRRVLLSPASIRKADWARGELVVGQSREQIRESPSVESHQPIGQRWIALSRECYTLPYYWALGGFLWGPGMWTRDASGRPPGRPRRDAPGLARDPYLRSARLIRDYQVKAIDGDAGHVEGFLVDDRSWVLRCVVVRTRHWRPDKRVLIPSEWIAWASWIELTMHVDLPVERILTAPNYDPSRPVTERTLTRLTAVYGRSTRQPGDLGLPHDVSTT